MFERGSYFTFRVRVVGAVIIGDVEVVDRDFGNVGNLCFALLDVSVAFNVEVNSWLVGYVNKNLFYLLGFVDSCPSIVVC